MNLAPKEFDTIKALVSFEMYEDFLLANIDKFDKVDFQINNQTNFSQRMIKHWKQILLHTLTV